VTTESKAAPVAALVTRVRTMRRQRSVTKTDAPVAAQFACQSSAERSRRQQSVTKTNAPVTPAAIVARSRGAIQSCESRAARCDHRRISPRSC